MSIDSKHPLYKAREAQWKRCRDTIGGTDLVKDAGQEYLPKLEGQSDSEYHAYKLRALYFPAAARTVHGLAGAVMRKDPVVILPSAINNQDDITNTGISLKEFSKELLEEALTVSRWGILVDRDASGSKSWLAYYKSENIINWEFDGDKLIMVVLKEVIFEKKEGNKYELEEKIQYRELLMLDGVYTVNLWRNDDKDKFVVYETIVPAKLGRALDRIPFDFQGDRVKKPVLLDLVDVNLNHYIFSADLAHGKHFTALPTATVSGLITERSNVDDKVGLGSTTVLKLDIGGEGRFMEFTGAGLAEIRAGQTDAVAMMVTLGARLISDSKNVAETAEKARIDANGDASSLTSISTAVSESIERSLQTMADWENATGKVKFKLNDDFLPTIIDAPTLIAMMQSVDAGLLSHETYYEVMQRGEIANPGRKFEDEKELIESNPMTMPPPSE